LADFLRLSRGAIDDSIIQNLNALLTPASEGFDPQSTSSAHTRRSISAWRRPSQPNTQSCQSFKDRILFPSWQVRSDVLNYCASVATSPDPNDPDQLLREIESAKARERVIDERLDPYSGRYFPKEARTESLAALIRNERAVEKIIRSRTWSLVGERCGGNTEADFEKAFENWRREHEYRK